MPVKSQSDDVQSARDRLIKCKFFCCCSSQRHLATYASIPSPPLPPLPPPALLCLPILPSPLLLEILMDGRLVAINLFTWITATEEGHRILLSVLERLQRAEEEEEAYQHPSIDPTQESLSNAGHKSSLLRN